MTPHELTLILQLLSTFSQIQPNSNQASASATPPTFQIQQSIAETADAVIRCYHPTAKYETVEVLEAPWSHQHEWNATSSALLRIHWRGAYLSNQYVSVVGLVERSGEIRGVLFGENAFLPPNKNCSLDSWVPVTN